MLSITGDCYKGRQALGAEIKSYAPSVNPGQLQVIETKEIKAEQGEITGLSKNVPSASTNLIGASKDLPTTSV